MQNVLEVNADDMWNNYVMVKPSSASKYATSVLKKLNFDKINLDGNSVGALSYTYKGETRDISRFEKAATRLLGDGNTNPKMKKNKYPSLVLYLTPASQSGKNFCPMATPGCIWSCLHTAGNPLYREGKLKARFEKSQFLINYETLFLEKVVRDIIWFSKKKENIGASKIAVRLNGTSDIPFVEMLEKYGLLKLVPKNVVFYDYTKFPQKAGFRKVGGFDYIVTYSRGEDYYDKATGKMVNNFQNAIQALEDGKLVAVVFRNKLPKYWFGYQVIDGDERDDLMVDLKGKTKKGNGIVIGLKAKGRATQKDKKTGQFVIDCDDFNDCRVK